MSRDAQQDQLKDLLVSRYRAERGTLWAKASGLPEWQARMPMTATGTNLLGLVKHVALVEAAYFGDCFGAPFPDPPAVYDFNNPDFEPDDDLWAFPDESPSDIMQLAQRAAVHADATIDAHALSDEGHVPWWGPDGKDVTLAQLLIHMLAEVSRHLGHADIVRELADGAIGYRDGNSNLPEHRSPDEWRERRQRLEDVAMSFRPAE